MEAAVAAAVAAEHSRPPHSRRHETNTIHLRRTHYTRWNFLLLGLIMTTTTATFLKAGVASAFRPNVLTRMRAIGSGSTTFLRSESTTVHDAAAAAATARRLYSNTTISSNNVHQTTTTKTTTKQEELKFADTPLGKNGRHLLKGLDQYDVPSKDDGHPIAVYGIQSRDLSAKSKQLKPILLLHGRTWSSVPVYHLMGASSHSRSLMEALLERGLQPYCMDFRGFGGTHHDNTKTVQPNRCVADCETVLQWIRERHDSVPALLGWSQGALVAQLASQKGEQHPMLLSKLILYGSIYDPHVRYAREPLYTTSAMESSSDTPTSIPNDFDSAIEDFTLEGTIPPEPAIAFAEAALISDPQKARWSHLYQFNNCDPARVHTPCLVIAGDQDPYASLHMQSELFLHLGRASDRTWSILSGSDHAVHLLDGRDRLINTITSFVMNGKRSEQDE